MQESLPLEHGSELIADTFEQLLDSRRIAEESYGHLQAARSDVTLSGLDIVWNPFHEIGRVFALDILHLLLNLLHRDFATEDGRDLKPHRVRKVLSA